MSNQLALKLGGTGSSTANGAAANILEITPATSNAHQSVVVKGDGSGFQARNDVPTYTATARDALTNVPTDFIIYNSTAASFQKYNGTTWDTIGGGAVVWGDITGTLSNQTDLQAALDTKQAILTLNTVTGTSGSMVGNNSYVANNASLVTLTLPTTCPAGAIIQVIGLGAGGWKVAQNASQSIRFGSSVTTTGTGGSATSSNQYDSITILCTTADTGFRITNAVSGNITFI